MSLETDALMQSANSHVLTEADVMCLEVYSAAGARKFGDRVKKSGMEVSALCVVP